MMPIMYAACMLAAAQHALVQAERKVRDGTLSNAAAQRETRNYWWRVYRAAKHNKVITTKG